MTSNDEQRAKKDAVTIGQIRKRIERERWEALHTDYLSVVEAMKQKIEAARHDPAELTRLRAENERLKQAEQLRGFTRKQTDELSRLGAERDEARRQLAEADRELQTIEAIAFGGLMPDGWNLDGLAGRLRLALIERDRERAELAERAAKWDSIVGVLVEKLKETPAVQSAARAAGGE
jgi:vacuolar-type H+-ATPase subunit I/STV1